MKILFISLLMPVLLLCLFGCSSPRMKELRREAALAKIEMKDCEAYVSRMNKGPEAANSAMKVHASKANALEILAGLEERPLTHPHADRVRDIFQYYIRDLAQEFSQDEVTSLMENQIGVCAVLHTLHLTQLLNDKTKYNFSRAERKRVDALAKQILTEGANRGHGLISVVFQAFLLKEYLEAEGTLKQKALIPALEDFNNRFELDRRTMPGRMEDAKLLHGSRSVLAFEYEQHAQERLALEYDSFRKQVFP